MQKLDAIVAATGAIVLVVAIGGAALYGGTASAETFRIAFTTTEKSLADASGTATGQGFSTAFTIPEGNVTTILVTVTFQGAAARLAAAPVVVEVKGPGNVTETAEGSLPVGSSTVTLEIPLTLGAKPADHDYSATSVGDAETHARTLGTSNGTGEWTVTARATPSLPPNEAVTADVTFAYTVFTSSVARATDLPAR